MKSCSIIALALVAPAAAFSGSSFTGSEMKTVKNSSTMSMEYIPSGMSKAQWEKVKNKDKSKKGNLGKVGITSFQSRTFAEWQKAGGKNLFPVDPKSVKSDKEIPYMQRQGGKPDDSDLKKGGGGGGLFSMFNKKKPEPKPVVPEPKKKNPWTF
mmetsp:Transcript_28473/g.43601  ORF Transcript_28473/g.43601 Transcript_28473/m.43601 type:complete len:154 (-) Transcript_28473:231-692(-)|eukprot:CAMPEP_0197736826 /NCGR_PEP_ID=MMETSP1435-20131217/4428_1 /TAXON_ID=426625 /ORGANISM="Chaetoceros brevis, Strain CCMP164" /LENGTH=153 /DNA_ID=CAMNT_0043325091 /DNA_START=39 /DNA_END=500 /DNA_ORIENTATION=-